MRPLASEKIVLAFDYGDGTLLNHFFNVMRNKMSGYFSKSTKKGRSEIQKKITLSTFLVSEFNFLRLFQVKYVGGSFESNWQSLYRLNSSKFYFENKKRKSDSHILYVFF